jgi:hypothetical protein
MRPIKGNKKGTRAYGKIELVCDIYEYEVALLSLYKFGRKLYFCLWAERKKQTNRFILFSVSDSDVRMYFSGEVGTRDLLKDAARIIVFEQSTQGRKNLRFVAYSELFEDYLPSENSYFNRKYATEEANELADEESGNYIINIDGEWFLEDWTEVTRLYKQVYAFNHSIRNIDSPRVAARVQPGLANLPFRGGYSIVNVMNSMQEAIPAVSRVRVESIQYASPGHIGLKVDVKVAADVERVMTAVEGSDDFDRLMDVYRECQNFLDDNDLRSLDSGQFNANFALYSELLAQLRTFAIQLLTGIGHAVDVEKLVSDETALPLVKTLLAYVRRIVRLRKYVDDGLITKFGGEPVERK